MRLDLHLWYKLIIVLSIYLMFFFPLTLSIFRYTLLFTIFCVSFMYLGRWRISIQYLSLFLASYLVCLFGVSMGLINANKALNSMWYYYMIYPVIYLYIAGLVTRAHVVYFIRHIFEPAAIAISLFLFVIYALYFFEMDFFSKAFYKFNSISLGSEGSKIGLGHPSMIFILLSFGYFIFRVTLVSLKESKEGLRMALIGLFISFVLLAISGRRAFQLILPILLMFSIVFWVFKSHKFSFASILIFLFSFSGVSFVLLYNWVDTNWVGLNDPVRGEQLFALLNYISLSPFFGHGVGMHVPLSYRSSTGYEWWVLYQIVEFGILGFLIILGSFVFIAKEIMRKSCYFLDTREAYVPMLFGIFGVLISSFTNPYLGKFDTFWILLFPFLMLVTLKKSG
jgi:hypothetical protein